MEKFYNSRWGNYLISITIYIIMWKIMEFEFTMIILGAIILAEIYYQYKE